MFECDSECGVTIPPTPHPSICPFIHLSTRYSYNYRRGSIDWQGNVFSDELTRVAESQWRSGFYYPPPPPPTQENNQLVLACNSNSHSCSVTKQWIDFLRDDPCCAIFTRVCRGRWLFPGHLCHYFQRTYVRNSGNERWWKDVWWQVIGGQVEAAIPVEPQQTTTFRTDDWSMCHSHSFPLNGGGSPGRLYQFAKNPFRVVVTVSRQLDIAWTYPQSCGDTPCDILMVMQDWIDCILRKGGTIVPHFDCRSDRSSLGNDKISEGYVVCCLLL